MLEPCFRSPGGLQASEGGGSFEDVVPRGLCQKVMTQRLASATAREAGSRRHSWMAQASKRVASRDIPRCGKQVQLEENRCEILEALSRLEMLLSELSARMRSAASSSVLDSSNPGSPEHRIMAHTRRRRPNCPMASALQPARDAPAGGRRKKKGSSRRVARLILSPFLPAVTWTPCPR